MKSFGFTAWIGAIVLSVTLHAVLAIGIKVPNPGDVERPAGQPTVVAGSLASILGGATQTEAANDFERPVETEVEPAPEPERAETAAVEPAVTKPAEVAPEVATQAAPVTARSASAAPLASEVAPEATDVQSVLPQTPPPPPVAPLRSAVKQQPAKSIPKKPQAKKKIRRKTEKKTPRNKTRQRRRKRAKEPASRTNQRAGSNRQGVASARSGGRGGRRRASAGAVRSYGARVRARILSYRPNASGSGRAIISFGVSTGGGLRYARITRSSGNRALDRAALASVRRAAPFPRPPGGARPSQLRFSISFSFR